MSIGSVGGFCVGSSFVVQHQVLSGQGYCFSASLPPLLAASAIEALNIIESNDTGTIFKPQKLMKSFRHKYANLFLYSLKELFAELEKKCKQVHQRLKALNNYTVTGLDISPVKHLRLSFDNTLEKLEKIVDFVSVGPIRIRILPISQMNPHEHSYFHIFSPLWQ
jgi:serine palmitoyltransferase